MKPAGSSARLRPRVKRVMMSARRGSSAATVESNDEAFMGRKHTTASDSLVGVGGPIGAPILSGAGGVEDDGCLAGLAARLLADLEHRLGEQSERLDGGVVEAPRRALLEVGDRLLADQIVREVNDGSVPPVLHRRQVEADNLVSQEAI